MPRQRLYTQRRFVDVTLAVDRQLDRLSRLRETTVPDLIRDAIRQTYGLPTEADRQTPLLDHPKVASRTRKRRKTKETP